MEVAVVEVPVKYATVGDVVEMNAPESLMARMPWPKDVCPVPPLVVANVPVHPKVRFCAEIEPVTLVSLVTPWTTFVFKRPAASVPVQLGVRVKVPAELVTLRRTLVSEEVAKVSAPVCAVPKVCWRDETPLLIEEVETKVGTPDTNAST